MRRRLGAAAWLGLVARLSESAAVSQFYHDSAGGSEPGGALGSAIVLDHGARCELAAERFSERLMETCFYGGHSDRRNPSEEMTVLGSGGDAVSADGCCGVTVELEDGAKAEVTRSMLRATVSEGGHLV